jgi:hypothetical protein
MVANKTPQGAEAGLGHQDRRARPDQQDPWVPPVRKETREHKGRKA